MSEYTPPPQPAGQPDPQAAPPGMYQASDGNFYPVPGAQPQPMQPPPPPQPKGSGAKIALIVAAAVAALCGLGGIGLALAANRAKDTIEDVASSITTVSVATSTTATASGASSAYQAAVDELQQARAANASLRSAAVERYAKVTATPTDREAALADAKRVAANDRTAVFDFDANVRRIAFPDAVRPSVNALLTENGALIAVLDQYVAVVDAERYDAVVQAENAATKTWRTAVDKVAQALRVPGTNRTTTTTGSPAGQVLRGAGYHMTVPPGFTGRGGGTITMRSAENVLISTGLVTGYTGNVAEVARQSAEAAASKQGAKVEAGPLDQDTGAGRGVGYRLVYPDGDTELSVLVAQGTKYVSISLFGPRDAAEAQMPAFALALSTFAFDQ